MIRVQVFNAHARRRIRLRGVVRAVRRVARGERKRSAAVSVVFIGNAASARMNRRYLGHPGGTDVISFPLGEGRGVEGEVYVNLDRARAQARRYRVSFTEEVCRLVVHGTLHLFGYEDGTARGAAHMKRREDRYVDLLTPGRDDKWI